MMGSRLKHQHHPAITPQPPSPLATAVDRHSLSLSREVWLEFRVSGLLGKDEGDERKKGGQEFESGIRASEAPPFFVFHLFFFAVKHIIILIIQLKHIKIVTYRFRSSCQMPLILQSNRILRILMI